MKYISFVWSVLLYTLRDILCIRTKPRVLQLPITSRCNSQCLTCNVWKNPSLVDINVETLSRALSDPFFAKLEAVGINGGEITLYKDYPSLINTILSVKSLKSIHIISNGIYKQKLLEILRFAKVECAKRKVRVGFTISIDGIGNTHNLIRGVSASYRKTTESLNEILKDRASYCDYIDIGCTISKYNVAYLAQIEAELSLYNIPVYYHLAVPNKRLGTFSSTDYSVLYDDRSRLLAAEFFLGKAIYDSNLLERCRNYTNYYYLKNKGYGRLATCDYRRRDVTIDENLNFSLCATASDILGDLSQVSASELVNSGKVNLMEQQIIQNCDTCIHYNVFPTIKGLFFFVGFYLKERYIWNYFFKRMT